MKSTIRHLAVSLLLVSVIMGIGGCALTLANIRGVPIPDTVRITKPGMEIPPEVRMFSGAWKGDWDSSLTHVLIVENIISAEEVSIYYCLGGRKTCEKVTGRFRDRRVLTFTLPTGSELEYAFNAAGKLEAKYHRLNTDAFIIVPMDKLVE